MHNHICHIEIEVTDLSRSRAFYEGVFGWKFSDFGIPDMIVFGADDKHIGGLMRVDSVSSGNSPSIWFNVASIDSTLETAQGLGASVLAPKGPVPNVGWSAEFADLDGNRIGIVEFAEG